MKHNIATNKGSRILALAILLAATPVANAQMGTLLYGSSRLPQGNTINPSFFPSNNKVYVTLPALHAHINMPLAYSDVIQYQPGDEYTTINLNNIMDALGKNGGIALNTDLGLFGFGVRFGNNFLTFSSQAKTEFGVSMPTTLLRFLTEGNYNFRGESNKMHILSGDFFTLQAYTEYALGFGHKFGNITAGAHLKLYNGYLCLTPQDTKLDLYTSEDYSTLRADMYYQARFSSLLRFNTTGDSMKISGVDILPSNWGVGADIGARYKGSFYEVALSILDIGPGITWKANTFQLTPTGGECHVEFSGMDISNVAAGGSFDTTQYRAIFDTLSAHIQPTWKTGESFTTSIPTKINASAMFNVLRLLRAGVSFHGEYNKALQETPFRCSTTAMAELNLFDRLEVIAGNTVIDNGYYIDWFNPGLGLNLSPIKAIQFYLFVDYMSSIYVTDFRSLNMYMGLNLMIGNSKIQNIVSAN